VGTARKLRRVLRDLTPLAKQGNVEGFFGNVKNADKLIGLVEDVRDAVMDYQVRDQNELIGLAPDIHLRFHCSKISTTRALDSS